jgi:hypothetical protein
LHWIWISGNSSFEEPIEKLLGDSFWLCHENFWHFESRILPINGYDLTSRNRTCTSTGNWANWHSL